VRGSFLVFRKSASTKREKPDLSRQMRRQSTDAETIFWNAVRNRKVRGAKFRRQWPLGRFFADFCCVEQRLIVEIDGGQHADSQADQIRTEALQELGYRIVRFWNNDVLENIDGVIERLSTLLEENPSPSR
jgi:very-short-patch-repair endonuclease